MLDKYKITKLAIKEYEGTNMKLISELNENANEMALLTASITAALEDTFKEEDRTLVCETAAEVLKKALQAIQSGQPIEDPALLGGLLVLAKAENRRDLDVTPQKLGLYANYAGQSDRINQELRHVGAGAKVDADRLQTDEQYRNEIMARVQKLVGGYDKVAQQAHQGAEQIKATRAAPSYAQGM